MGGKAAMMLALTAPARVRRLIVADIAPVAYRHSQMPYVRAMQGVDLATVSRRSEGDAALAAEVPEAALRAFLLQSLAIEHGRASWKLNLDALAAEMPMIMDFPDIAGLLRGPRSLPDRRDFRLRPPGALAAHPRALPGRRAQVPARSRPLAARRRAGRLHRRGDGVPGRSRAGRGIA